MSALDEYTPTFFDRMDSSARSSADVVVPQIVDLLSPTSVIDVGSGRGEWLAMFLSRGVDRGLAIDGPWVDETTLAVSRELFRVMSLDSEWTLSESFDLALCLEVAEHLPKRHSDQLVANLISLAPSVLFSAALPGQEGTHHINEQWPEFWRQRFEARGYKRLDIIRPRIWQDDRVAWYYQQNMYLFVTDSVLQTNPRLRQSHERARSSELTLIHPKSLRPFVMFKESTRQLPQLAFRSLKDRLRRTVRRFVGSSVSNHAALKTRRQGTNS